MLLKLLLSLLCTVLVAAQQPHIVFIFMDDLGWNDVGYHGSEIMVRKALFLGLQKYIY